MPILQCWACIILPVAWSKLTNDFAQRDVGRGEGRTITATAGSKMSRKNEYCTPIQGWQRPVQNNQLMALTRWPLSPVVCSVIRRHWQLYSEERRRDVKRSSGERSKLQFDVKRRGTFNLCAHWVVSDSVIVQDSWDVHQRNRSHYIALNTRFPISFLRWCCSSVKCAVPFLVH